MVNPELVFLRTRLASPPAPPASVPRARLLHALGAALQHPLTLVSAAAGWGKTTALGAWAASLPQPAIWLSLDEHDNHPARFWIALLCAIQQRLPGVGSLTLAQLSGPEPPPPSTILAGLLDDLAAVDPARPTVIILDDFHAVDDPAIHKGIALLVDHLPAHVHLVLATRVDPDLPLARWRVRGVLYELRADELRFTPAEAQALLARALGADLADDDARRLAQRTEGWAAGLHLVGLALRQQHDRAAFLRSFAGSHRFLLDYVHEEVLARQPPHIQRFLLRTAIVRAMSAPLCAALTDEAASQELLEWLERHNLFVVPLDDERRWYRIHDLFREVLLARLRATEPASVPLLHRRAARWYAEQGELHEAVSHAFASGDFALAAEQIAQAAPVLWLHGEAVTVHAWLHALPDETFRRHIRLALDTALRLPEALRPTDVAAFTEAQARAEQTLIRVEAGLRAQGAEAIPEAEAPLLRRRLRILRATIEVRGLVRQADIPGLRRLAEEVAELAEHEEPNWEIAALACMFWLAFTFRQEEARLIPRLLKLKQRAIAAGEHAALLRAMVYLAHLYRGAGQLRLLEQECREGIDRARQLGIETAAIGNLQLSLAEACYAWDDLEAAGEALQQGLQNVRAWAHDDLTLWGLSQLARLALARHDLDATAQALDQAEELVQRERFLHWAPTVAAARAQLQLARGQHAAVDRWLAQTELDPQALSPGQSILVLTKAQLLIALRRYEGALELLERFAPRLDTPGHVPTIVAFLALSLVALCHTGQSGRARAVAERLFALTEPEGDLRSYLDLGVPMRQAIAALPDAPASAGPSFGPRFVAFRARLLAAFGSDGQPEHAEPPSAAQPAAPAADLPEPLTQREREVLRLLVDGRSNQEIAAQLVITVATAKKHVSNILAKLGVKSRAQAIARARLD